MIDRVYKWHISLHGSLEEGTRNAQESAAGLRRTY